LQDKPKFATYKECVVWGITQVKISSEDWPLRMPSMNYAIKMARLCKQNY